MKGLALSLVFLVGCEKTAMRGLVISLAFLLACGGDYSEQEENQVDSGVTETSPSVRKTPQMARVNQSTGGNVGQDGQGGKGGETNQGGETVSSGGSSANGGMGGSDNMDAMGGVCFIAGCRYPDVGCCYNKNGGCLINGSCSVEGWERIGCVCK